MPRRWPLPAVLLAGALAAACGALPGAMAPGDGDAGADTGLVAGEAMQFELRVAGIVVGNAAIAVGEPGEVEGRPALAVTSRIVSTGLGALISRVDDQATTVLDLDTWRPMTTTTDATYGARRTLGLARFAPTLVEVELRRDDKPVSHARFVLGDEEAHDAHSAMAAVRTWSARPGEQRRLWIIGGRRLWRTDVTCVGEATLGTAAGNRPAIQFDGVSARARGNLTLDPSAKVRTFSVWLSADADRVPLRVVAHTELGDAELVLVDYQRP
ncbi:MAG: DUF3108 domain-containing protein [Kofleriaceae bacterium]